MKLKYVKKTKCNFNNIIAVIKFLVYLCDLDVVMYVCKSENEAEYH